MRLFTGCHGSDTVGEPQKLIYCTLVTWMFMQQLHILSEDQFVFSAFKGHYRLWSATYNFNLCVSVPWWHWVICNGCWCITYEVLYLVKLNVSCYLSISLHPHTNLSSFNVDEQSFIPSIFTFRVQYTSNLKKCKVLHHYTPSEYDSTNTLHITASDRCSLSQWSWQIIISETEDEEVEAGPRSEKETERSSGWGGGGGKREGSVFERSVCVGVYSLTLKCFPAGDGSVSHRPLPWIVSQINSKTYMATRRWRQTHW